MLGYILQYSMKTRPRVQNENIEWVPETTRSRRWQWRKGATEGGHGPGPALTINASTNNGEGYNTTSTTPKTRAPCIQHWPPARRSMASLCSPCGDTYLLRPPFTANGRQSLVPDAFSIAVNVALVGVGIRSTTWNIPSLLKKWTVIALSSSLPKHIRSSEPII